MTEHIQIPENYPISGKRVFIAGHRGMLGSALVRRLVQEGCEVLIATRGELDLLRQADVESWMADRRPDAVILAAARVGGIHANTTRPAEFLYENLVIETNVIHAAYRNGVEKLLFAASSCMYPRLAEQPMREAALLTGALEPTNEGYALAKLAGIRMCQTYHRQYGCNFISAIPPNLYGPNDNFDPLSSHVIPGLMRRTHAARAEGAQALTAWGTGKARREFLYVDDAADGLIHLLKHYSGEDAVNVGFGKDVSIRDLVTIIADVVGYGGTIEFDTSKPDGMPVKLLEVSRMDAMGWKARTQLKQGLDETYRWFLETYEKMKGAVP